MDRGGLEEDGLARRIGEAGGPAIPARLGRGGQGLPAEGGKGSDGPISASMPGLVYSRSAGPGLPSIQDLTHGVSATHVVEHIAADIPIGIDQHRGRNARRWNHENSTRRNTVRRTIMEMVVEGRREGVHWSATTHGGKESRLNTAVRKALDVGVKLAIKWLDQLEQEGKIDRYETQPTNGLPFEAWRFGEGITTSEDD